ncbi:MAG TPA: TetR family transcriptional regulator [Streptosporangiaceae bacterium]
MSIDAAFQRARRPEQKQQRQEAILDAARELAERDGVRSVSLADIAQQVGIHKSALLRYFETREQIFLKLTARAWLDWSQALHAALDPAVPDLPAPDLPAPGPAAPGPGAAANPGPAELVADAVARSFAHRPLLCDLIPHTALNLERHVSVDAARHYKLTSLAVVADAARLVQRVLPDLTVEECGEFVATMAALAGSWWQIANPTPVLAELFASDPQLAGACVDLPARLRRTAEVLLAGLIPSRPGP